MMRRDLSKVLIAFLLFFMPEITSGQVITLGSAAEFVLFTTAGPITNSGTNYLTRLTGKVGSNSGAGTGFGNVDGTMHSGDAVTIAAAANLLVAYGQLNTAIPTAFPSSALGNGGTFTPGVYSIATAATLNGTLTFDALGNPAAVFIVKINGALAASANSKIRLVNGALACNVYWKTEGLVTIGSGSTIRGNIVANNAAISMGTLDTLEGRAFSLNGAITMNSLTAATPIGCGSPVLTGPAAPNFGAVGIYAIFSSIGPVTNSGGTSYVMGDIGTNLGSTTGYNPLFVNGTIHPNPDISTAAAAPALTTAYNQLHALPNDIVLLYPALFGHGLVITPHTYVLNGATALTDTLYLNAQGNINAVFVIKVNGALNTIAGATVKLMNGTQSKNVYWKVEGAVNLVNNTTFHGNIVANSGAIDIMAGSKLYGRALTTTGAITTTGDSISAPLLPFTSITGDSTVCVGSSTILIGIEPGGTWSVTNARATITSTGVLSGISAGLDTVRYAITNVYGTSTATKVVNVIPMPDAGTISGPSSVCVGSSITLTSSSPGGLWTANNATATVVNGVVTGITAGTNTINYTVINICGTATTNKIITVYNVATMNPPAGQTVCNGALTAPVVFSGPATGTSYTWTNNNTSIGLAASGNGNIAAFTALNSTAFPVMATITVTPSINGCAGASQNFMITVNPTPNATAINNQAVCNNTPTTTVNFTGSITGTNFAWTNDNTTIGLAGSGNGNIPSFTALNNTNVPAVSNIVITPSANGCTGPAMSFTITVNPTPDVAATPDQTLCRGAATNSINYTGSVSGTSFSWTNNNTSIGLAANGNGDIPSFAALNPTNQPAIASVIVTPSANGCTGGTDTFMITVNPTPDVAAVASQEVCNGLPTAAINYTGTVGGSAFTWINSMPGIGLPGSGTGNIPSFIAVNNTNTAVVATITVTAVANGCPGTAFIFTITVNPTPDAPVISLGTPPTVCNKTYFRNFGAATLPPTGMKYTWSTMNAAISDTGNTTQYTLVNFKNPGAATVFLTSTVTSTGCLNTTGYNVDVTANVADTPAQVIYFNKSFVCLQNNEEAYAWGYDDAGTLAPTSLTGEMNQDYVNAAPDLSANRYWVMVTHNGCIQKTYYNKPEGAVMRTSSVSIFPNPASQQINVGISSTMKGDMQMEIYNVLGRKMYIAAHAGNNTTVDVSAFPPGVYTVICYGNNEKVTARFIKN